MFPLIGEQNMSWYRDSSGREFITTDGKPPSGYGVAVTSNGQSGYWDGQNFQPTK